MRLVRLALLWIGACTVMLAAPPLRSEKFEGYKHTAWTVEDGGPSSVRSIVQAPNGYIWMVGGGALLRFDGVSFERMPTLSDPEMGDYQPQIVHASPNGDIFVTYYRPGAVGLYRHGRLYDLHMPNPAEFVTRIEDDGKGGIWVVSGRDSAALSHYQAGKWRELGEGQGVPRGQVFQVFVDRSGTTWLLQSEKLLFMRAGANRFEVAPAEVGAKPWLGQGPDGRLWLMDRTGLRPLPDYPHGATGTAAAGNKTETGGARSFVFDRQGNLWGTDANRGLFRVLASQLGIAASRAKPSYFTAVDGLTSDEPSALMIDREGLIWVGTNNGLDRLRKVSVQPQAGFDAPSLNYGGESDAAGVIYILDDAGIHAIGPGEDVKLISKFAGEISAPCRLADGSVVVIAAGKLLQLRPDGLKVLGSGPDVPPYGCASDARGRLWIWTGKDGLSWRDPNGWHSLPTSREASTAGELSSTPWGVALLRIGASALMRLDPEKQTIFKASALGVGALYSINEGRSDLLISGSRGLARVRDGAVRIINGDTYPWLNRLRSLTQTRRGDTWMQSSAGILRVRTSVLDSAFEHPGTPLPHDLFDAADGLAGRMQKVGLWGRQIYEGADGVVRFLTSSGVVAIDPAAITHNHVPPTVVVSSLTSRGVKYLDPATVALSAAPPSIVIAYSALSLAVPERVRFLYKLDGVDDDWVDPGKRREAVYGNLAPGSYHFHVIAANNDGVWNRKGATLLITVAPTFYQTTWFKALCLLAIGLLLWWAYAVRLRQVTGRLRASLGVRLAERERIARELHDTLLQTFQGLVLQFQAAANRLPAGQPAHEALDRALKSADAALVEGRNRVRELRVESADGDLTKAWVALAAELGEAQPVRFELTIEGKARDLHPLVQDELKRMGEEALRNAYQHSGATVISMTVGYRPKQLLLDVRDNGVGLPREVASRGQRLGHYGLIGMRERARRIGGVLSIVSREGEGTEVLLSIPGKAAYVSQSFRWGPPAWFKGRSR